MDRHDLTATQGKLLSKALFPHLNYFLRLLRRMEALGFSRQDRLYLLASDAYDAVHALSVEVHYLSCKSGVGNPPKE